MKKLDAYEDEKYLSDHTIIWKRDPTTYTYKYCNLLVNSDYETQFCIIGLDELLKNIDRIKDLYKNLKNDFIILENKFTIEYLCNKIDQLGFSNMKCYSLIDENEETLINYFTKCYKFTDNYEIISSNKI
jgi:hypothetical protein